LSAISFVSHHCRFTNQSTFHALEVPTGAVAGLGLGICSSMARIDKSQKGILPGTYNHFLFPTPEKDGFFFNEGCSAVLQVYHPAGADGV
jgi:hypothetical protein